MRICKLVLLAALFFGDRCFGATVTAASSSYADVNTAVNTTAARGDTVIVPAGTSEWDTILVITKGVSLIGNGAGSTNITTTQAHHITIQPDATALSNEETIRVSGFTLDGQDTNKIFIRVFGAGATDSKPFKNLIIDNNTFADSIAALSSAGTIYVTGQTRGVIHSNLFDRCYFILRALGNNNTTEHSNGNFPFAFGNGDTLFFEDNTIQWSTAQGGSDAGFTETGQGGRACIRYNSWDNTNVNTSEWLDIHGFQNWPGGQTGTMIFEAYGNTYDNASGFRSFHNRGGSTLIHNNIGTGVVGNAGNSSYNSTDEVPGATGNYEVWVESYIWNNTDDGTEIIVGEGTDTDDDIQEDTHWWKYNAAFDGTSGIGRGTSAPGGTCTVGVGYWVASTATPTVDPDVIQNGVFYQCQSTDVWTAYYTPYTYPHPLRTAASRTPTAARRAVLTGN